MEKFVELLILLAGAVSGPVSQLASSLSDGEIAFWSGSGLTLAFALGMGMRGQVSESILSAIRRWHGGIDDRFANIDNLVRLVTKHQATWAMPADLYTQLTDSHNRLQQLINRCRTNDGSRTDREHRNSLLKTTVSLCLLQVKIWAYAKYTGGVLTLDDVHQLGFLLPGETSGHHGRAEATDVLAHLTVKVINEDFIRVVISQSADKNAARVAHGWPQGVDNAIIVITASDGKKEVYRQLTSHLRNDIRLPEGSHGMQFIIKAAFLKHVNDEPRFGNEVTFSMPLTTQDLVATIRRQPRNDYEEQQREIERYRQEIARLQAELNAVKK